MSRRALHLVLGVSALLAALAVAQPMATSPRPSLRVPDATVIYARVDTFDLKLDLYFPASARPAADSSTRTLRDSARVPYIAWFHGGGWRGGTRADPCPALPLIDSGYAVASVEYRLSQQAPWPAQIHDAKAALRWLRAHADSLRLDTARTVAWGTSAGGQLAALLGLTVPGDSLEGTVGLDSGATLEPAGRPRAAVLYHAPSDFLEYHTKRWKKGSSIGQLLGCAVPDCPLLARRASPVAYVTTDDPPLFIAHGLADTTVPASQSLRLDEALRTAGVTSELVLFPDTMHGGPAFETPEMIGRIKAFLEASFAR